MKNNKKKLKAPKLRFPEFTDDWEECELGEILKTHSFRKYLAIPQTYGDIEIIQQGDKPILGYSDGKPFTEYADIILFGDHTVSLYKPTKPFFIATDGVKILSADGFDGQYLFATLERYKPESQGYKRHFTILKNKGIWFTKNKNEQFKIGSFFKEIDQLITLNQNKISHIKDLKAGLLQKMFPKNGENKPEIRFDGFTDDWKECKLGDIAKITMGQSPDSENYTENPADYILVQGNSDMKDGRVVPRVWTTQVTKISDKGDLIFSVRAPVGDIGKTDYDVVLGRGVAAIKGNEFLFQLLGRMKYNGYWMKFSTGSTFESINSNDIKEARILLPNISEQQRIGEFFSQLDNLLTLYKRKVEHLQEQKKSLLKQMFI